MKDKIKKSISNARARLRYTLTPAPGCNKVKWNLLIYKTFFERGYSQTNYIKYVIALFGLSSLDVKKTLIFAFIYVIFCFILGLLYYAFDFAEIESEIGNKFNPFTKEMRSMKDKIEK